MVQWSYVLPKVMYFVNTCAAVPWGRYKVVYFHSMGFSAAQIGAIRSGTHFAKMLSWPLWGMLCDAIQSIRFCLLLSLVLATISLECMRSLSVSSYAWATPTFGAVLLCAVLRSGMNAGWPLVDAATLALVQREQRSRAQRVEGGTEEEEAEGYGQQRLWGAVAWGASSLVVGMTIDNFGLPMIFYLTYLMACLEIVIVYAWLPSDLKVEADSPTLDVEGSPALAQAPGPSHWVSPALLAFFANVFLYSLIHAIPEQVLFLDMERHGASRTLQGAAAAATVVFEIPVFYYANSLLESYGTRGMFLRAQAACAVRLFLCYMTPATALVLLVPIQALHGLSFGLMWAAAVPYIQHVAPPGKETFAQSLVCTIWGTMGQAVGSVLWGYLYDRQGAAQVYLAGAFTTLFTMAVLTWPHHHWKDIHNPKPTPSLGPMAKDDPFFGSLSVAEEVSDYIHGRTHDSPALSATASGTRLSVLGSDEATRR
eukprot:Rhum_TRINITY_DN15671_c0_g1::Rhum_TRINITY_DN15671_c0_g1_i1::g.161818::m.161818